MHLNDATLQMIIAQNNRNGFEIWNMENIWEDSNKPNHCALARVSGSQEERLIDDRISQ